MKIYWAYLLLLTSISLFSQNNISGTIKDVVTNEPVVFANISVDDSLGKGTFSDIDGKFQMVLSSPIKSVTISALGYSTVTILTSDLKKNPNLFLEPKAESLNEVYIPSKENPAWEIIRKVQQNQWNNHPDHLQSYSYRSYNKIVYDMLIHQNYLKDSTKINEVLKGGHLLISETISEKKYIKPHLVNQKVIATQTSGFKRAEFAVLPENVQPISFYDNELKIMDNYYLNPISNRSFDKYVFRLKNTLFQNQDTIYIITFTAKSTKNINGLNGELHINRHHYAIQNVIATAANPEIYDFKIQQQYELIDDHWFPKQLQFSIQQTNYVDGKFKVKMEGKNYFDDIRINPDLSVKNFTSYSLYYEKDATQKDALFWENNRTATLKNDEKITYKVLDSIGTTKKWDKIVTLVEKLIENKIPMGFVDIPLPSLIQYNLYEKTRLGLGLETNDAVSKYFSINAYSAYGFGDKKWKYGVGFDLKNDEKDFKAGFTYKNDVVETGQHQKIFQSDDALGSQSWVGYQYDWQNLKNIHLSFRPFRFATLRLDLNQEQNKLLYSFQNNSTYNNTVIQANLRFALGEEIIKANHYKVNSGTDYPVFYLSVARGLKNIFKGDYQYHKIESAIEQQFKTKNLGLSEYRLSTGFIEQNVPYGLLFTGEGNYNELWGWESDESFQTMKRYEFLSDRYINLLLKHDFGGLLFKWRKFQPDIQLLHQMSWGNLKNPVNYTEFSFKTKENVYMESGIVIKNIIKINYLKLVNLGFGIGGYYRWGYYTNPNIKDNVAFKINFNVSTK